MRIALKLISLALLFGVFTLTSCEKEVVAPDTADTTASNDPDTPGTITVNGHDAVDLGLSTRWAACNVGAANPEDYGNYYAWGETETKLNYNWGNYKFGPNYYSLTKYCTKASYGTVDNKTVLDPEDDVAHVTWGGNWRMPTVDEMKELLNNCTWEWTTKNNIYGCEVKAPNGNSIFLPAAGYQSTSGPTTVGEIGYYASSSLNPNYPDESYYLYLTSYNKGWSNDGYRQNGLTVRPVIAQ